MAALSQVDIDLSRTWGFWVATADEITSSLRAASPTPVCGARLDWPQSLPAARSFQRAVIRLAWPLDRSTGRRPHGLARPDRATPRPHQRVTAFGPPLDLWEVFSR